jgi:hypothetical protein
MKKDQRESMDYAGMERMKKETVYPLELIL